MLKESIAKSVESLKEELPDGTKQSNRPNIGFINPPYSLKGRGLSELQFVKTMLDILRRGGTGIAIVPIGCAIEGSELKQQILSNHTLEAVISMPDDLFKESAAVVTCIMIFTAHKKHPIAKKVWFSRCKDDGFVTLRHIGRVDHYNRWPSVRTQLLSDYVNRVEKPGVSVLQSIASDDEWCAEAYIKTDYNTLHELDFETTIQDYLSFLNPTQEPETERVDTGEWSEFTYGQLFEISRGNRVVNRDIEPGETPLIRCIKNNNGVTDYVNLPPMFQGNAITVNYNGSVGEAFYQPKPFYPTDDVLVLQPKSDLFPKFNQAIGLFVCAVIKLERFRFHYSRKWNIERMNKSLIRLPSIKGKVDVLAIEAQMSNIRYSDLLEVPEFADLSL